MGHFGPRYSMRSGAVRNPKNGNSLGRTNAPRRFKSFTLIQDKVSTVILRPMRRTIIMP
jgi:hypothetical protein